jgi:NMD protein affecting ribosome stability and mRNA decay
MPQTPRVCPRCGEPKPTAFQRWGLCRDCNVELDAIADEFADDEVDTTMDETRRALGVLHRRAIYLNDIDEPEISDADVINRDLYDF